MNIKEIIKNEIEPRLEDECRRLGIPRDFIIDIGSFSYGLEYGYCKPVIKDEKIIGVKLKIHGDEKRPRGARGTFFGLMKYAQQYYKGEPASEIKARTYQIKRGLEEDAKTILRKITFGRLEV